MRPVSEAEKWWLPAVSMGDVTPPTMETGSVYIISHHWHSAQGESFVNIDYLCNVAESENKFILPQCLYNETRTAVQLNRALTVTKRNCACKRTEWSMYQLKKQDISIKRWQPKTEPKEQ